MVVVVGEAEAIRTLQASAAMVYSLLALMVVMEMEEEIAQIKRAEEAVEELGVMVLTVQAQLEELVGAVLILALTERW